MTYTPSVPVIRHKNRSGKDNPVSGAIQVIPVQFDDVAASEVVAYQWSPPAGMNFEIIDIYARCTTVASDPSITIGSTVAGAEIVAAVNLTTALGALTLLTQTLTPTSVLDVRVTADSGDSAESVSITIVGYCTVPPDAAFLRGVDHF